MKGRVVSEFKIGDVVEVTASEDDLKRWSILPWSIVGHQKIIDIDFNGVLKLSNYYLMPQSFVRKVSDD